MRPVPVAIVASMIAHAAAFAWVLPAPIKPAPAPTELTAGPTRAEAEPIAVAIVTLDPPRGETAPGHAGPSRRPATRPAIATSTAHAAGSTTHTTEPGTAEPSGSSPMAMRRPGVTAPLPDDFVDNFLLHGKPPRDPELLPEERIARDLDEARHAGDWLRIAQLRDEQRKLDLQPSGGGTYKADKHGFDVNVSRDGTPHIHDKPTFDATDALMRAVGLAPYSSEKLRVLDRTRDARAILRKRTRHEQLAHSAQLVQGHIDRLWAKTTDLAARKQGLFDLWDECAETGDDDVVAGGADARATVIGWIQLELHDADAYTADELARLNAHRHSKQTFAPYLDDR